MDPESSYEEAPGLEATAGEDQEFQLPSSEVIIPPGFFSVHGLGRVGGDAEDEVEEEVSISSAIEKQGHEAVAGGGTEDDGGARNSDNICSLVLARQQSADEKKAARRAAWTLETRKEIQERRQFQEALVAGRLPELVWEGVLGQLSSQEKAQASRMSWMWWHSIKHQRTQFLLREVYPILGHGGFLGRSDVLNFRLVSKEWKLSLETYLQNIFFKGAPTLIPAPNGPDSVPITFQREPQQITRFLEWTAAAVPPNGNPFPSRKLVLGVKSGANRELWAAVHPLLERWGKEVWQVVMYLDEELESFNDTYMEIHRLLTLMPNLRSLGIFGNDSFKRREEFEKLNPDEAYRRTGNLLRDSPLPEMPKLKNLITNNLPNMLSHRMVEKYGQMLETYTVCSSKLMSFSLNVHFPRLKELYIISNFIPMEETGLSADWPLLEDLCIFMTADAVDSQRLFKMINRFGETLRKLQLIILKGSRAECGVAGKKLSLELPNVEDFSVTFYNVNPKSLDFMLPMVSLKFLTVYFTRRVWEDEKKKEVPHRLTDTGPSGSTPFADVGEDPAMIQFWDRYDGLYESNVWTLFPELKWARVVVTVIRRLEGPRGGETESVEEMVYTREKFANIAAGSKALHSILN